jgi:hypothetical protein
MRLYSGRKINRSVDRRFRSHTESRDAIVWDVDEPNGVARCKIQGSDEYILCHYAQNWATLPYFVKPGFAVRIVHKGGSKGFQEILGPGRAIPSPVLGDVLPPPPPLFDGIVTGMLPTETGSGMFVAISAGTFRIDNITYTFVTTDGGTFMESDSDIEMASDSEFLMGSGTNLLLPIETAPTIPEARYDLIVVAIDGVADVVKGVASTNPVMPAVPADHIEIAHVLVLGGVTEILQKDINALWEPRLPHNLTYVLSGGFVKSQSEMYCSLTNPNVTINITMTIRCQYGWPLSIPYEITLNKDMGVGSISTVWPIAWSETGPCIVSATGSTAEFQYARDETLFDPDPPAGILEIDPTGEFPPKVTLRAMLTGVVDAAGPYYFDLLFEEPPPS